RGHTRNKVYQLAQTGRSQRSLHERASRGRCRTCQPRQRPQSLRGSDCQACGPEGFHLLCGINQLRIDVVAQGLYILFGRWIGIKPVMRQPASSQIQGKGHLWFFVRTGRKLKGATAMSILVMRPADQPYQRRTAKKVRRASSSPVRISRATPVSFSTSAKTSSEFGAERTAEVAKAMNSSQSSFLPSSEASLTAEISRLTPLGWILPSLSNCSTRRNGVFQSLIGVGRPPIVAL